MKAVILVFRLVLIAGIVLQVMSSPAHAYWKAKVAVNERMAAEYISRLKDGADPDRIERPTLRYIEHIMAKQERKKFVKAMDDAEALARAGKHEQIKELGSEFRDLDIKDR